MNNSQQSYPPSNSPQPQSGSYKKLWIILGIVINVLVLLTVGYVAWAKVADAQKQEKEAIAAKGKAEEERNAFQKKAEDAEKRADEQKKLLDDEKGRQQAADYIRQVSRQLDIASGAYLRDGFTKTHEYEIDVLPDRGTDSFTLTLQSGWQYNLISYCDADCSDIDITVYDQNNNQIDTDTSTDAAPIVAVRPRWTGEFRIRVVMHKCSNSPCVYGIGAFGKG